MANTMRLTLQLNAIDNMSRIVQGAAMSSKRSLDSIAANSQKRAMEARSNMFESGMLASAGAAALAFPIKMAANYEMLRIRMIALTQSQSAGMKLYGQTVKLASETPLTLDQVATATTRLIGFGRTAKEAIVDVKMLGDVVTLAGGDINAAMVAYGQAAGEGRVMTRDLTQFVNAGVPIFKMLGEVTGANGAELKKMAEQGQLSFAILEEAFRKSTSAGGQFADGMKVMSGAAMGIWPRFTDEVGRFAAVFGDALLPSLKEFGEWIIPIITATGEWFRNHQTLTTIIGASVGVFTLAAGAVFGYNAIVWLTSSSVLGLSTSINWLSFQMFRLRFAIYTSNLSWAAFVGFLQLARIRVATFAIATWTGFIPSVIAGATAVAGWTASIWAFTTAILSVPIIGWILAVVAAMIALGVVIYKNWDAITAFFSGMWQSFKDFLPRAKTWGSDLISSIVEGIKSAAPMLFNAIDGAMTFARGFFPASPAKRGAFKDIQRIKIIEQVAKNIKPNSLAPAMQAATEGGVGAIGGRGGNSLGLAPVSGGSGGVSVNYSPTITIGSGVSKEDKESFTALLERHKLDLARMVGEVTRSDARKQFATV